MNVLTIIVLIIFLVFILNGYRKGFIRKFASMFFFIAASMLVYLATPHISSFLKNYTPVYKVIEDKCEQAFLTDEGNAEEETSQLEQIKFIENLEIPEVLQKQLTSNNNKSVYENLAVESFKNYIISYLATLILNIISYVVTFILVSVILRLAIKALDVMAKLPIIHGINQFLGLFLGLLQGVLVVWLIFLVITIFSSTSTGRQLLLMVSESPILTFIYDSNLLLKFLFNTTAGIL